MFTYGHYCPVAKSAEILGDRWTLMIVRELLFGVCRFNEFHRSLPGISRSVLAARLRRLEDVGVLERVVGEGGTPEYRPTAAGEDLRPVVKAAGDWAARWVLTDPTPRESDPDLLISAVSRHVNTENLPDRRVVVCFDLLKGKRRKSYWLVMDGEDVSLCLQYPGFEPDVVVTADVATFYKVYIGRMTFEAGRRGGRIRLEGSRSMVKAFPSWMEWSHFNSTVREAEKYRKARTREHQRAGS